ncbi:hypothetical protein M23134_07051 [Microscilla marina ATCC 23134]|uniref:Uncharacterized protein n=1 Tax=Microscilla marina ATCC 23134 TaxID=313606 RepID=A1ZT66_MICM2|nr:hypothetical protein M23134_07051 [Microscilla marina ATCC 23134]
MLLLLKQYKAASVVEATLYLKCFKPLVAKGLIMKNFPCSYF